MVKYLSKLILGVVFLMLSGCVTHSKCLKDTKPDNYKGIREQMSIKIDSSLTESKYFEKYRIVEYTCKSDSTIEVEIEMKGKMNGIKTFYLFNYDAELLRIQTELEQFY